MKKTFLYLSLTTLSLHAINDDGTLTNAFTLTGDFAYFKREQGHHHKLIIDNSTTDCNCHFPSCQTRKLIHDFPFEPGFKVTVTYTTDYSIWDFSYLWLNTWEKECYRNHPGALIFSVKNPSITQDFDGADHGSATYTASLQNCELNYFRYTAPRHTDYFSTAYVLGLRYISLKEALDVSFTKNSNKSSYKVHTTNHIPTLQVGGLLAWNSSHTFTWDLMGTVGIGFDAGEQKTFLGDLNNTMTVRDYEKTGFSTPFIGAAALRATYQPVSYFNMHAAYQFIYLTGVVLAPDQLVKSSSNKRVYRAIGAPLYHGLTAGLSWSF